MNNKFLIQKPIITLITIVLTCLAYLYQTLHYGASINFGLNMHFVNGAYWQVLTSMFIHGGAAHLLMNMVVLFQFGSIVESVRGAFFIIFLYYFGGVVTSLLSFLYIYNFSPYTTLIGASGAICVLIGWMAQKDSFNRKGLFITILLISFLPLLLNMNIAWYAHIIGFGIGFLFGLVKR